MSVRENRKGGLCTFLPCTNKSCIPAEGSAVQRNHAMHTGEELDFKTG